MTSVGFSALDSVDYVQAVQILRPDIVFGLGDVVIGQPLGQKRKEKMGERTQAWVKEMIDGLKSADEGMHQTAFFAPILPLPEGQQSFYLMDLGDDLKESLSGLVLYEADSVITVPDNLCHLPRLCVEEPDSPHAILDNVASGVDIFTIPFLGAATDAGIALDFSFPPVLPMKIEDFLPLGVDLWVSENAAQLSSLRPNCPCYTCIHHHRAYVHHLLDAKEMLGWVLLQIHNYQVVDDFFSGIRQSIKIGSFHQEKSNFTKLYESQLPARTGQGPRSATYRFLRRRTTHQILG